MTSGAWPTAMVQGDTGPNERRTHLHAFRSLGQVRVSLAQAVNDVRAGLLAEAEKNAREVADECGRSVLQLGLEPLVVDEHVDNGDDAGGTELGEIAVSNSGSSSTSTKGAPHAGHSGSGSRIALERHA